MRKTQVFLREDQKAALKSIAARTGRRQSELIRKGVDLVIAETKREQADWREVTRSVAGMWADRTDLDDVSHAFRSAAKRRFSHLYRQD